MTGLQNIRYEHVLKAAASIDQTGVPADKKSREWDVIVNGHRYPPKYLICVASECAGQGMLNPDDTRTGKAQRHLEKLGFRIVSKS